MRKLTFKDRCYLAVAIAGLLILALAGVVAGWARSLRPARRAEANLG